MAKEINKTIFDTEVRGAGKSLLIKIIISDYLASFDYSNKMVMKSAFGMMKIKGIKAYIKNNILYQEFKDKSREQIVEIIKKDLDTKRSMTKTTYTRRDE